MKKILEGDGSAGDERKDALKQETAGPWVQIGVGIRHLCEQGQGHNR